MLTADEVLAVVRVHADRVHDAVRRLGCGPEDAAQVVELSAHDLVDAAARDGVDDPVGWWFARARARALAQLNAGDDELPVGGGVLGVDDNQVRLAEALEQRPETERAALLLRDSYDLPAASVGTTFGVDADAAMELVGRARLAFLPELLGGSAISLAGHQADLAAIARLAEGGQPAARDATTRRHVQSCARCADALDAMERARRLLSGLTVVALPDEVREVLLSRVEARARKSLPTEGAVVEGEWDDEPRRPYSITLIGLGLVVAIAIGVGAGIAASRGSSAGGATEIANRTPVTAPPPIVVEVPLPPSPTPPPNPLTDAADVHDHTVPTPSATPTVLPTPSDTTLTAPPGTPAISLDPFSGPNDTVITVTGSGWTPGATVQIAYQRATGGTGATAAAQVDTNGAFSTQVTAHDPTGIPGGHQVTVTDGTSTTAATFTAT